MGRRDIVRFRSLGSGGGEAWPQAPVGQPQADQPGDHDQQRGEARSDDQRRAVQRFRHRLRLRGEGALADEEGETHAPEVPGDPRAAGEDATQQDAGVEGRAEQGDRAERVENLRRLPVDCEGVVECLLKHSARAKSISRPADGAKAPTTKCINALTALIKQMLSPRENKQFFVFAKF